MRSFGIAALCTFLLVFGGAWYWIVAAPMRFLDGEYPMWKAKTDRLDACDVGTLAIIGDSKAVASIIPTKIGPGVRNFAVGGGGVIEMLKISQRMLNCPTPPKAVVVTVKFNRLKHNFIDTQLYWDRTIKFNLLHFDWQEVEQIRKREREHPPTPTYFYDKPTPFDIDARLKDVLYVLRFPPYYFGSLVNGRIFSRYDENQKFYIETYQTFGQHHFGIAPSNWDYELFTSWDSFIPDELHDIYFTELIKLYEAHNIPLYFISPPYNSINIALLNPAVKRDVANCMQRYQQLSPNVHMVGDLFPTLPPDDFGDMDHPNYQGALEWSETFTQELKDAHIPGGPYGTP